SEEALEDVDFWLAQPWEKAAKWPTPKGRFGDVRNVSGVLDRDRTATLLTRALTPYRLHLDDALVTAFGRALARNSENSIQSFHFEKHGRDAGFDDLDVSRTVGWFTVIYPVVLEFDEKWDIAEALLRVRSGLT